MYNYEGYPGTTAYVRGRVLRWKLVLTQPCSFYFFYSTAGTGSCWYGLEKNDCNPEEVYIAKCNNDPRQRFTFLNVGNEEVLIKLGNGENRCFQRQRRAIVLDQCDENNSLQRFFAPNGSFDGIRFELSQRGFSSQCVSTAHHPKPGEVVETHDCDAVRNDSKTSYWNKYWSWHGQLL